MFLLAVVVPPFLNEAVELQIDVLLLGGKQLVGFPLLLEGVFGLLRLQSVLEGGEGVVQVDLLDAVVEEETRRGGEVNEVLFAGELAAQNVPALALEGVIEKGVSLHLGVVVVDVGFGPGTVVQLGGIALDEGPEGGLVGEGVFDGDFC